jgi:hypothetical protein
MSHNQWPTSRRVVGESRERRDRYDARRQDRGVRKGIDADAKLAHLARCLEHCAVDSSLVQREREREADRRTPFSRSRAESGEFPARSFTNRGSREPNSRLCSPPLTHARKRSTFGQSERGVRSAYFITGLSSDPVTVPSKQWLGNANNIPYPQPYPPVAVFAGSPSLAVLHGGLDKRVPSFMPSRGRLRSVFDVRHNQFSPSQAVNLAILVAISAIDRAGDVTIIPF